MSIDYDPTSSAEPEEAVPPVSGDFLTLMKEMEAIDLEIREHEDRLKVLAERRRQLEPLVIDIYADQGLQNFKTKALTFFVAMDRYCSKKGEFTTQQVCESLKINGLGYMVSDGYNAASLKSKFKEWQEGGVEPPADLAAMMNIGETARLRSRK